MNEFLRYSGNNINVGMKLFWHGLANMWVNWNWLCLLIIGGVAYIVYRIQRDDPEDWKK